MIDDTRGATWNYSSEIILEPLKSVGIDNSGIPKFMFYKTPAMQITKVRKVLLEDSDISQLKSVIISNASVFAGKDIIKSFSSGSDFIVVGTKVYYPGSVTYVDYPEIGTWSPPPEDIEESVLTTIVGYDSDITPYSAGEYKGRRVVKKFTEIGTTAPSIPQGAVGNKIYMRYSPSNYRNINGVVYRDVTIEYREF